MFDTHVHTKFSPDSKEEIAAVILKTKKLGLGAIITEHLDFDDVYADYQLLDYKNYLREYEPYRGSKLLVGVELGMSLDRLQESKMIMEENPFDYVIGSVHMIAGKDPFDKSFYEGKSKEESYGEYLRYILQCLKSFSFIDSLGHIDFMCRYSPYDDKELKYDEFSYYIDEIFKALLERDKVLEISTRRLGNKEAAKEMMKIYSRYHGLGGRYVTLGSDAHYSSKVGENFKEAVEIAEQCKLTPVYFRDRKLCYI